MRKTGHASHGCHGMGGSCPTMFWSWTCCVPGSGQRLSRMRPIYFSSSVFRWFCLVLPVRSRRDWSLTALYTGIIARPVFRESCTLPGSRDLPLWQEQPTDGLCEGCHCSPPWCARERRVHVNEMWNGFHLTDVLILYYRLWQSLM